MATHRLPRIVFGIEDYFDPKQIKSIDRMNDKPATGGRIHFERVTNQTLRHRVIEPIRNAILFGQMEAGQRLTETELAEEMGVSRVPVREALHQLEQEGLVISSPHRGTVVASIDEDEVDVLYQLRAELEGFTLRSVLERQGTVALGSSLAQLVEAMRKGASQGNLEELAERDLEFHRLIVASSGYPTLSRVWSSMDGPIRARLYRSFSGPFSGVLVRYAAESHQPIVDAILSEDVEVAVQFLKNHILETRRIIESGVDDSVSHRGAEAQ